MVEPIRESEQGANVPAAPVKLIVQAEAFDAKAYSSYQREHFGHTLSDSFTVSLGGGDGKDFGSFEVFGPAGTAQAVHEGIRKLLADRGAQAIVTPTPSAEPEHSTASEPRTPAPGGFPYGSPEPCLAGAGFEATYIEIQVMNAVHPDRGCSHAMIPLMVVGDEDTAIDATIAAAKRAAGELTHAYADALAGKAATA